MRQEEYYARGWNRGTVRTAEGLWPDYCPHCVRFKGKRPRNLSPEEIRKSVMTFAAEIGKRPL